MTTDSSRKGPKIVPWAVLAVGLATTAFLYASIGVSRNQRNGDAFKVATKRMVSELDGAFDRQIALLEATAGTVEAKPDLSRQDFANDYRHVEVGFGDEIPATLGVSFVQPWSLRDRLVSDAAKRGVSNFRIDSTHQREEVHAVFLVEPLRGRNLSAAGYDMHMDPIRRAAMDAARDGGKPVLTAKTVLKLDGDRPVPAFLLYLPLYRGRPSDVASRRANLRGFVYSGLRADSLFRKLQGRLADEKLGMKLYSGAPAEENLVASYGTPTEESFRQTRKLEKIALGDLTAEFFSTAEFGVPSTIQPLVPPVGIAISVLLFALATVLRLAHESSERQQAEGWLLAEVGRLTSGAEDDGILDDVAKATSKTLSAVCRIDLLEDDGKLRTINTRRPTEALTDLEKSYPRWENDQLLRKAVETGETQRADAYPANDAGHALRLEALGVGPIAIVPMRVHERFLGAITLTRSKGGLPFSNENVALLESIAGRIALAIDNARLYQAIRREKAELEHRVEERTRDLEASNHELESFCYSVSHDLRSPLRSLDGFSRALEEDYGDRLDAEGLDFIVRIRAAAKRMDELITALLTLSRLTRRELALAQVDVSAKANDIMQDLDPEGRVAFSVEPNLTAEADPRMIAVVLENLLANAIKFSSRSESPRVEVGRADDGAIFVRDNGAGFDPQYGAKLFQPFERLHSVREFPGHGIGLATVERILRRHGGEVRAEGKVGQGATFYVRFPTPIA